MKKLMLFGLLFVSFNAFTTEVDVDEKSGNEDLYKALDSFKINKDEIRKSLENLKAAGKISNAEYLKSLEELNKMDDKKIDDLSKKAVDIIKKQGTGAAELPKTEEKK